MSTIPEQILEERTVLERRLDSLSWLLEGTSMCSAVSIIDGKLYVSANDFFDGTTGTQHLAQVHEIMEYFKGIALRTLNDTEKKEKRDQLMISIFKSQISIASLGRITISNEIIEKVINSKSLIQDSPYLSLDEESKKYLKSTKQMFIWLLATEKRFMIPF